MRIQRLLFKCITLGSIAIQISCNINSNDTDFKTVQELNDEYYRKHQRTPEMDEFFGAIERLDHAHVMQMLREGYDVNQGDYENKTAIIQSAIYGDRKMVELLIEHGSSIHERGFYKRTPLFVAAEHGNYEAAKLLLELGSDVNITIFSGDTILDAAETRSYEDGKYEELIELLKMHGAKRKK